MSRTHIEKIKCPKCGKESDFIVYDTIDTSLDPQMKLAIRNGDAFGWRCTGCDNNSLIFYPTIYHQVNEKYLLCYVPGNPSSAVSYMKELEADRGDSGYIFDSSYTKRVVTDMNQLREKLMILDAGLDDRIIELMKLFIIAEVQKHKPENQIADIFFNTDNDGVQSFAIRLDNDMWGSSEFSKANYSQVCDAFKTALAVDDEVLIDSEWALTVLNKEI